MADVNISSLTPQLDVPLVDFDIAQGTAINAANSYFVTNAEQGRTLIVVKQTDASARVMTVHAGNGPAAGIGNLEQSLAQNEAALLCLESSRFNDTANGNKIKITFASGFTGYIMAVDLPKEF